MFFSRLTIARLTIARLTIARLTIARLNIARLTKVICIHPQNRHPERSASQIFYLTQRRSAESKDLGDAC